MSFFQGLSICAAIARLHENCPTVHWDIAQLSDRF